MPSTKYRLCERFVRNDLAERKFRSRRLAWEKFLELKEMLGLDSNEYSFGEQDIISALQVAFKGELCMVITVFKTKDLTFTFLNTNLE